MISEDVRRELLAEGVSPERIDEVMASNKQSPSGLIEFYKLSEVLRARVNQRVFFERGRKIYSQMPQNSHTFKINGDIAVILKHTKFQKLIELRLPYPSIQIENHSRQFPKIIHISVSECTDALQWQFEVDKSLVKRAYQVACFYATDICVFTIDFVVNEEFAMIIPPKDKSFFMCYYNVLSPIDETLTILKNFLNFVNCRECILIDSKTQSIPPHLRNSITEIPKNPDTTIVAITDKLVRYLNTARSRGKHGELDISFWVRGHWRRLQSEHWTHKKGQLTWVHPYIKGEGELHKHDYKLRKLKGETDGSPA
jgi:hypothetical protein